MKEKTVNRIREFHRFYLPEFALLGNSYLGSEFSATEARVLYEIYMKDGCTASFLSKRMNVDKSYLSRMIRNHERRGYLTRVGSNVDSRAYELHLTAAGIQRAEEFIRESNAQIFEKIRTLSDADCQRLVDALDTVTNLLKGEDV